MRGHHAWTFFIIDGFELLYPYQDILVACLFCGRCQNDLLLKIKCSPQEKSAVESICL